MSADKIIYSELFDEFFLLAENEKNQPVKTKEIPLETNTKIVFTGTNKKKTVFVYNDINQLSENDFEMLKNIVVKGIGWTMDELAIMNLSENPALKFEYIKIFFLPKKIIFWGCEDFLNQNKIPQKIHEVMIGKEIDVLNVYDFSFYTNNVEMKKNLWLALKKMFDIK